MKAIPKINKPTSLTDIHVVQNNNIYFLMFFVLFCFEIISQNNLYQFNGYLQHWA